MVLLSLMLSTGALAKDGRPAGHDAPRYQVKADFIGKHTTLEAEVLDIDIGKGLVAYKLVQSPNGDQEGDAVEPSVACAYAGMQDPHAGVTLALIDLGSGTTRSFEIYPLVDAQEKCATQATSEKTLAEAKAAFAQAGLDITRTPDALTPAKDGSFTFQVDGEAVKVEPWSFSVGGEDEELYTQLVGSPATDIAYAATWSGLTLGGTVLFTRTHHYWRNMAGYDRSTFTRAWQQGDKVVFEVERAGGDMHSPPSQRHSFSPVVTLE